MTPATTIAEVAFKELTVARTFNAPKDKVFEFWIDPTLLAKWWGPKGFTNIVSDFDLRPRGNLRIDMKSPQGEVFPMLGEFHEITQPDRLVFSTLAFIDDKNVPGLQDLNRVSFYERDGKTEVVIKVEIVKASPEVLDALAGMEAGWLQSLDKLESAMHDGQD